MRPKLLELASQVPSEPGQLSEAKAQPVLETLQALAALERERAELERQRKEEEEEDMRQLYDAELEQANEGLSSTGSVLEQELLIFLGSQASSGGAGADERDAILEFGPGVGGLEAAFFAGEVMEMYERLATAKGWEWELRNFTEGDQGSLQAATIRVAAPEGAYGWLRSESGVHRVQRVPATERKGRMQTSSATVVVLPVAAEGDLELSPQDVRLDISKKSSGPGGQSVNASFQAVRATYLPTGFNVLCNSSQSQFENKRQALELLRTRLLAQKSDARASFEQSERRQQRGTGDRSEKIRTYNFQRDDVTDHILGKAAGAMPGAHEVLFGHGLEAVLSAHRAQARKDRLEEALAVLSRELQS